MAIHRNLITSTKRPICPDWNPVNFEHAFSIDTLVFYPIACTLYKPFAFLNVFEK